MGNSVAQVSSPVASSEWGVVNSVQSVEHFQSPRLSDQSPAQRAVRLALPCGPVHCPLKVLTHTLCFLPTWCPSLVPFCLLLAKFPV